MMGYIFTGLICLLAAGAVGLMFFRRRDCCSGCRSSCKTCAKKKKKL